MSDLDEKLCRIQQIRKDTDYIVGRIAEKMHFTQDICGGCHGSGLAPAILGVRDRCALCVGTGKKLDLEKSFTP